MFSSRVQTDDYLAVARRFCGYHFQSATAASACVAAGVDQAFAAYNQTGEYLGRALKGRGMGELTQACACLAHCLLLLLPLAMCEGGD
jgi:hypothetical protein